MGFVQGGLAGEDEPPHLVSLGTVFVQPMMLYARGNEPIEMLAQLKGKRMAIGPAGSGTRALAQKILKANEMDTPPTTTVDLGRRGGRAGADRRDRGRRIPHGRLRHAEGDAQPARAAGIELMSFRQADGYLRKFRFLSKLNAARGRDGSGQELAATHVTLMGPSVELVAREDLHPALSDLLISAAREIHSRPGLFRAAGEYPAPLARDFPISDDAERYYKSGGQFLYKRLPFWLASLVDRLLVLIAAPVGGGRAADPRGARAVSLARTLAHLPLVWRLMSIERDMQRTGRRRRSASGR